MLVIVQGRWQASYRDQKEGESGVKLFLLTSPCLRQNPLHAEAAWPAAGVLPSSRGHHVGLGAVRANRRSLGAEGTRAAARTS